jgi:hypothetical protein
MKKSFQSNTNRYGNIVETLDLDKMFNFDKEQKCYEGQYMDLENKIPYERWTPVVQKRWENFKAKCMDAPNHKISRGSPIACNPTDTFDVIGPDTINTRHCSSKNYG